MLRVLLALAMLSSIVHAQGVRQTPVTADDVLLLFDNSLAVETPIPAGATGFTLSFGSVETPMALSTFLRDEAETLRVVVFLPDPSEVTSCPAGETEITVLAIEILADEQSHHRQESCVTHPAKNLITGALRYAIVDETPSLNEWQPFVVHSWLINIGQDEDGGVTSAVSANHLSSVQIHFTDGNTTAFPPEPAHRVDALLALPPLREAIDRYGLVESSP